MKKMEDKLEKLEAKMEKQLGSLDEKLSKVLEKTAIETAYLNEDDITDMGIFITEPISKANKAVIDSAAPKSIVGEGFLNVYSEDNLLDETQLKPDQTSQSFRFGDGEVFPCTKTVNIPMKVLTKMVILSF